MDLKTREELDEQLVRPAIGIFHRNDAIAGREQREQRITDGGHAGSKGGGRLGAFEVPDLIFERSDGWIRIATVDVPAFAAESNFEPLFDRVVPVGDAERDRNLRRAGPALPALDRKSVV